MVEISFRLVDFMDARPLPGATVEFTLTVVPRFPLLPDEGPGPAQPPRPDERFAESLGQTVVTGADGRAALTFDATDVFSRLTGFERDDPPGHSVDALGTLSASARLLGIRLPRAELAVGLGPSERLEHELPADLGMSLVGHTTPESARLWFHLPFEPTPDHSFTCHVAPADPGAPPPAAGPVDPATDLGPGFALTFDETSNTAVARTTGLAAGGPQDYALVLQRGTSRFVLAGGRFRTPAANQPDLAFAFGSCHLPVVTGTPDQPSPEAVRSLELWQRLDGRDDSELLLLIGDQIYGDGIEDKWENDSDFLRYLRRYRQLWAHRPTRSVLRSMPTYMILDDHDVADDYGIGDIDGDKVHGALLAYGFFQHAHGPSDRVDPPFHYSFRRGPAAFFVMDGRTQRGEGTPVFGQRQLDDLRAWARSPDTRAADLIFFVAPVPLALLPTEIIRKVVDELSEQALTTTGALLGLGLGLLGIPAPFPGVGGAVTSAAVLGAVGYAAAEVLEDHIDRTLLLKADLGERWDLAANQPDLVRLLDLLFDLANGVGDDPPRKRAVFILSGDIHAATMHLIRSLPDGPGLEHRANPLITQLTSSAISHEPVNSTLWVEAVSRIDEGLDLDLKDINLLQLLREGADWERLSKDVIDVDDVFGEGDAEYFLDPNHDRRYLTQYAGLLMERTVGHVDVRRTSPQRRAYRIRLTIEGQSQQRLESVLDVDLDAPSPSGLILDPASLSFAVGQAGGTATRSITIENIAGAAVDVTVLPPPGGPFSWQPATFTLQHDEARTVEVRFRPTSNAVVRGRLTLTSSAPNSPHRVRLAGKGAGGFPPDDPDAPEPPGDVELAPDLVSFGSVALNSSATRTVTITNKTGAAVTLAAAASAPNAQFRWSGFDAVLVNNGTRTVSIAFHPAANGVQRGRFTVRDTGLRESHSVDLLGKGGIGGFPTPTDRP